MKPGNIILLNGTSSAGKSTLSKALQDVLDEPYLHTGIDHFLHSMPTTIFRYSPDPADVEANGWVLYFRDGEMIELPSIGPAGLQILLGMYEAIAAYSRAGNHAILDDAIYDPRVLRAAIEALQGLPVLFVGVRISLEDAIQREIERGDRALGAAGVFYHAVHTNAVYDIEVNTSEHSPEECARQIKAALRERRAVRAFDRLRYALLG
jgi:chloramphenicol 3-O phosphotransferase